MPFCYEQTSPLGVPLYAFGFSLSVLHAFFLARQALCRRFAASPCAAGAEARCTYFAQIPHAAVHGTITSRGAEHRSRKTKLLHLRQHTHAASFAPARSFRGRGGIETPAFLVLLTPKEQRPPAAHGEALKQQQSAWGQQSAKKPLPPEH